MGFGDFAIAPSTTATLCAGVPLAKGSEDTFLFGSAGEQASKISSYAIATFSNLTYQRNTRNVVRLGMPMGVSGASSALRANYLIFNNSAFEGKNIYCFVDSVDYVNNNTIDVTFTIDAMQTFMFDYDLHQCYVEREHSVTDEPGENCIPEDFGEMPSVVNSKDEQFIFRGSTSPHPHIYTDKYEYVIYSVPQSTDNITGRMANNLYVGTNVTEQVLAGSTGIDNIINDLRVNKHETIVAVIAVPTAIVSGGAYGYQRTAQIQRNTLIGESSYPYTPHNKKLLTYPYNYICVSNNNGEEKQYRWEWFDNHTGTAQFTLYGAYIPSPEAALIPENYKGSNRHYGEGVYFTNFPGSAWSEDSFLSWKQRNQNSYDASVTGNKIGGVTGILSGAVVGASVGGIPGAIVGGGLGAISSITTAFQQAATVKDQKAAPDNLAGNASASAVNELIDCTGFTIYYMSIPGNLALTIDDYFTMYGYATKRVKIPNRDSRPKFNYVKTQGCTIYGSVPAPFAEEIQNRYNNGVRFWRSSATIGDYTGNEVT